MVENFVNNIAGILQDVFVALSDLVPRFGATNLVLIIALFIPVLLLMAMRIWSAVDRFLIRHRLEADFEEMAKFVSAKNLEIKNTELYIATYLPPISAECMRAMELAKRICSSMREVLGEMATLLRSNTEHHLLHAQALRHSPLVISASPLETVQLDVEIPELPWEEWQPRLSSVLAHVSKEIEESKLRRGEVFTGKYQTDDTRGIHAPTQSGQRVVNAA
ncbi:MAG: hypothetical protein KDD66_04260 [Bdellovibrionales bacterium]|nr:hypothetical protein [Bdellovibrionales bacterium]